MLVAVEKAIHMAHAAEDVDLEDDSQVEGGEVEVESGERTQVLAHELGVALVDKKGYGTIEETPEVHRPLGKVGHLLVFGMDRHLLVQVGGMDIEDVKEPVVVVPFFSRREAPGRFHRVLWIRLGIHIGGLFFDLWDKQTTLSQGEGV